MRPQMHDGSTHQLKTRDGLCIAAREFAAVSKTSERCLIVVPGFAQHSGTNTFTGLCRQLSSHQEIGRVLCIDPRGNGLSSGRYDFGASEHLDVLAALAWARERFRYIDLLGFSLGAYSSLRAACENTAGPDRLFLVSIPTSVNRIIWEGAAVRHALRTLTHPAQLAKERELKFRWGNPLTTKPRADEFVMKARQPLHFLVGTADLLVPPTMSRKVFAAAPEPKSWTALERGEHAELLYYSDPQRFANWLIER